MLRASSLWLEKGLGASQVSVPNMTRQSLDLLTLMTIVVPGPTPTISVVTASCMHGICMVPMPYAAQVMSFLSFLLAFSPSFPHVSLFSSVSKVPPTKGLFQKKRARSESPAPAPASPALSLTLTHPTNSPSTDAIGNTVIS